MKINLILLDGSPEPLDEEIITMAALATHTDPDAILFE